MKIVNKEDVLSMYEELLPWEKAEVMKEITDRTQKNLDKRTLLNNLGISPIELVDENECVATFGASNLMDNMDDWDIADYAKDAYRSIFTLPDLIELLEKAWDDRFTNKHISKEHIKKLDDILHLIKKENEKE